MDPVTEQPVGTWYRPLCGPGFVPWASLLPLVTLMWFLA